MKSKINVYQQKKNPVHRGNVYSTFTDKRDKYDLYFKNRFTTKYGGEKYDEFEKLNNDYVLYKKYLQTLGAKTSLWKTAVPDKVQYEEYSQGFDGLGLGLKDEDYGYIGSEKKYNFTVNLDGMYSYQEGPSFSEEEHITLPKGQVLCNSFNNEPFIQTNTFDSDGIFVSGTPFNIIQDFPRDVERDIHFQGDYYSNNTIYRKIYQERRQGMGNYPSRNGLSLYPANDGEEIKNMLGDEEGYFDYLQNGKYDNEDIVSSTLFTFYLCKDIAYENGYEDYNENGYLVCSVKRELNINQFMVPIGITNNTQTQNIGGIFKTIHQNYIYDGGYTALSADGWVGKDDGSDGPTIKNTHPGRYGCQCDVYDDGEGGFTYTGNADRINRIAGIECVNTQLIGQRPVILDPDGFIHGIDFTHTDYSLYAKCDGTMPFETDYPYDTQGEFAYYYGNLLRGTDTKRYDRMFLIKPEAFRNSLTQPIQFRIGFDGYEEYSSSSYITDDFQGVFTISPEYAPRADEERKWTDFLAHGNETFIKGLSQDGKTLNPQNGGLSFSSELYRGEVGETTTVIPFNESSHRLLGNTPINENPVISVSATGAVPTMINPNLDGVGYTYQNKDVRTEYEPYSLSPDSGYRGGGEVRNEVQTPIRLNGGEFYNLELYPFYDFEDSRYYGDTTISIAQVGNTWLFDKTTIEGQDISLNDHNYHNYIGCVDYDNDYLGFNQYMSKLKLSFVYNNATREIEVGGDLGGPYYPLTLEDQNEYTIIHILKGKIKTTSYHCSIYQNTFRGSSFTQLFKPSFSDGGGKVSIDSGKSFVFDLNPQVFSNAVLERIYTNNRLPNIIYPTDGTCTNNTMLDEEVFYYRTFGSSAINYQWPADSYEGFADGITQTHQTIVIDCDEYELLSSDYLNGDIISLEGAVSYQWIDLESLRYGFSYPIEKYFPFRSYYDGPTVQQSFNGYYAYVDYDTLQDMFDIWYSNSTGRPDGIYEIQRQNPDSAEVLIYNKVQTTNQYTGHIIGISASYLLLKQENNTVINIGWDMLNDENRENVLYPLVFELSETIPALFFDYETRERMKIDMYAPFEEPDPEDIYERNQTYVNIIRPSDRIREWKYSTLAEYNQANDERWLTEIAYQFPTGTMVPTQHWPQMLYEDKRYSDVEIVSSDDMDYPELGYYPPKEEMLPDNFKTEIEEGQAIYRFIGNINEYYSTVKAGSIYLPSGTDIEEELLLTPYDDKCENNYIETNPYGYEYIGEEDVVNKNALTSVATSTDFGAYPKDGIYNDDLGYEYIGTNEEVEYIGTENELRSNANFNIDINSNQDFTIGDVAGASFTVDIQGNIRDTILYLGRKCKLYYDFENKDDYKDFGLFTIDDVKFMNHQVSTITAYDNIKKFDAPVYEYLTSDNVKPLYPMTAKTLFQLMCEYCEVPYYTTMDFLNSDKLCYGPFGDANLTARQVLSYVAELAAGYIVCDTNGFAVIKTMKPYINLINRNSLIIISNLYTTDYENIIPLLNSANIRKAEINRTYYSIKKQVNQKMDIFPTEIIDSIVFNNADTESFINYRKELNAIYDLSDNPFLAFVDNQVDADEITNGILDQIAILIPPIYEGDPKFYSGEIELKNFDYSTFGTKQIVKLLDEIKGEDFFIPTTISISETGITLTAKGQPKYSTKIVNSELAKQVNSLKMNIKEIKLTIPDALADTLDNHGQQISAIETDLGAVQEDISAVQESVSSLDTALETQRTQTSTQFTNVNRRDDGQDDRLDGHDTDIAAIQQKNTTQDAAIGNNTSAISTLTTTVGGLPTKSYVDNLNQVNSITNGGKLSIGEDEVSFYTDNGYLFISDGTTTGKLKLEVNA